MQASLGVPLNFTYNSNPVTAAFGLLPSLPITAQSADLIRQDGLSNIEHLLAHNVSVAFVFGDRDYRCPWTGGIATALAAKWGHQGDFAAAGYEELVGLKTSEHGAVVKQYGRLSFSRVLDAGHSVSAYAPETVYRIFERTRKRVDVVAGRVSSVGFASSGPGSSWGWRNRLSRDLPPTCMVEGRWTKGESVGCCHGTGQLIWAEWRERRTSTGETKIRQAPSRSRIWIQNHHLPRACLGVHLSTSPLIEREFGTTVSTKDKTVLLDSGGKPLQVDLYRLPLLVFFIFLATVQGHGKILKFVLMMPNTIGNERAGNRYKEERYHTPSLQRAWRDVFCWERKYEALLVEFIAFLPWVDVLVNGYAAGVVEAIRRGCE